MRPSRPALAVCGVVLAAVLAACGSSSSGTGAAPSAASSSSAAAAPSSAASVSAESRAGDVMFAQMMIPHHEQAVEMSDLALKSGAGAEVTALATQIKAAQGPEIATMQGWLAAWGASAGSASDHMGHMPGMMSADDMTELASLRGSAFDDRWLRMMIAHHEGALTMAQDVLSTTQDPQVRTLAEAVVSGQTAEIATMKGLLAG